MQTRRKIKIMVPWLIVIVEQTLWSKRELSLQTESFAPVKKALRWQRIIRPVNAFGHYCKAADLSNTAVIMRARWRTLIGSLLVWIIPPVFMLAPSGTC